MKTQTQFKNASLVSVINGSIVVKDSTERVHTFTNASVVSVNNGTIIIKSEWKPKEGELIKYILGGNTRYGIFKEISKDKINLWTYGCSIESLSEFPDDRNCSRYRPYPICLNISPVTPEEQKEFDDFCKSQGMFWNKETLQWEEYKWKPQRNEIYYYVGAGGVVDRSRNDLHPVDLSRISYGNYFKTRAQAEKAAEKVKELFQSL